MDGRSTHSSIRRDSTHFSPRSQWRETQDASRPAPPHVLNVCADCMKTPVVFTPMLCKRIEYRGLGSVEESHHGWMGGVEPPPISS